MTQLDGDRLVLRGVGETDKYDDLHLQVHRIRRPEPREPCPSQVGHGTHFGALATSPSRRWRSFGGMSWG